MGIAKTMAGRTGGREAEVGVGRTSWHSGRIIEPASSLRGRPLDRKNFIFLIYSHQLVLRQIL